MHDDALERERLHRPLGQLGAPLGRGAERRQAPGQQPARGAPRARAARAAPAGGRSAPRRSSRARSPARSARSAQASSLPRGARRETRLQKARSSSSCSGVTHAASRAGARRAQRERRSRCRPPTRAHASAPSVDAAVAEQAQRAQQPRRTSRPRATASRGSSASQARAATNRWSLSPASPAAKLAPSGSACEGLGCGDLEAVVSASSGELIVSPCRRGHERRRPRCATSADCSARASAARSRSGRSSKSLCFAEHVLQQRQQSRPAVPRAGAIASAGSAPTLEQVAVEPVEVLQQRRPRRRSWAAAPDSRPRSRDELAGERPVAVQGGPPARACASAAAARARTATSAPTASSPRR